MPSRPARAPRPSAWARPLKAIKPSSSRSPPTASGPRTTGSSPGATATGSARADLGHGAARDVAGIDVPDGDGEPGAPARASVRRPGDDLHPRVGHRVAQPGAPAGRDRRLDVPGGPGAEGLEAVLGAGGEGRAQGAPGRRRVERRGREVEAVVFARGLRVGQARVVAGGGGGGGRRAGRRAGAARDRPERVVAEVVRLGRARVTVVEDEHADRGVVDGRRLGRVRPREARDERALADDRHLRVRGPAGVAQRALGQLERRLGHRIRPLRPRRRGRAPAPRRARPP